MPGAGGDLPCGGAPESKCFRCLERLSTDPAAGDLERPYGSRRKQRRRGRRLDCRAYRNHRCVRHVRYPIGLALPQERRSRRLPDWKTLDASKYRQCACRSRDRPPSARVGRKYPGARPLDQAGPVTISRRSRCGAAGGVARGGACLTSSKSRRSRDDIKGAMRPQPGQRRIGSTLGVDPP
jgi:hypothetical protein